MEHTIAALATPPGEGGLAVVRISGERAYEVAGAVFRPRAEGRSLADAKGYTAMLGFFEEEGQVRDEVVALCFRAPKSYTGEDVVELSCHGGSAVCAALLRACCAAGAQPAGPGEFTKRAFLNGRISLTQAEAVMDLIGASSRQGAAAAAAAMEGALYRKIEAVRAALVALAGHIAAFTDYPEEDVEELSAGALRHTLRTQTVSYTHLCSAMAQPLSFFRGNLCNDAAVFGKCSFRGYLLCAEKRKRMVCCRLFVHNGRGLFSCAVQLFHAGNGFVIKRGENDVWRRLDEPYKPGPGPCGLGPAIGGAGSEKKGRGAALPGAGMGQRRRVRRGAVFADMLPEPPCADS